ncbi:putative Ribosomal protein S6 kinase alpha-3 [Blattamonas nauphoetae]|uniref:non-specific serine/threonine protein kinase n=1 Tax=Blattamonas nauphoetae TaxID=2049346 RepID=A0ABQ9WVD6_9EUKA|nr:putative Ribosomal protein S6 kinase alpha-3 [Blattamonas nauphoetae]
MKSLKSPFCVKFEEAFSFENRLLIVMEYCENDTLSTYITHEHLGLIKFSEEEKWKILGQVVLAINDMHTLGILHRDLNPGNIFMAKKDEVKVGDFGNSYVTTVNHTHTYSNIGQLTHKPSDMWAFGVIAYQFLFGHLPFSSTSAFEMLTKLNSADYIPLPHHASSLSCRILPLLLEKNPEKRMTALQFLEDPEIRAIVTGQVAPSVRTSLSVSSSNVYSQPSASQSITQTRHNITVSLLNALDARNTEQILKARQDKHMELDVTEFSFEIPGGDVSDGDEEMMWADLDDGETEDVTSVVSVLFPIDPDDFLNSSVRTFLHLRDTNPGNLSCLPLDVQYATFPEHDFETDRILRKLNENPPNLSEQELSMRRQLLRQELEKLEKRKYLREEHIIPECRTHPGERTRKWFQQITAILFSPSLGLFETDTNTADRYNIAFDDDSLTTERSDLFTFAGFLLFKAINSRIVLGIHLNNFIWRMLCSMRINQQDIFYIDSGLSHLVFKLQNEDLDTIPHNFTLRVIPEKEMDSEDPNVIAVETDLLQNPIQDAENGTIDQFGTTRILLKEEGDKIRLNKANFPEFIDLICEYLRKTRRYAVVKKMARSFTSFFPPDLVLLLHPENLDNLIKGHAVNVAQWKEQTHYDPPASSSHPTIQLFWDFLNNVSSYRAGLVFRMITGCAYGPQHLDELKPTFLGDIRYNESGTSIIWRTGLWIELIPEVDDDGIVNKPVGDMSRCRLLLPMYRTKEDLEVNMRQALKKEEEEQRVWLMEQEKNVIRSK